MSSDQFYLLFYCDCQKFDFTGGFLIFLFLMTGRAIIFICSAETGRKSDVSFANNFSKDSKLSGRSFIYTKKRKGPSIEPCGTPARTGDQFED